MIIICLIALYITIGVWFADAAYTNAPSEKIDMGINKLKKMFSDKDEETLRKMFFKSCLVAGGLIWPYSLTKNVINYIKNK